MENMYISQPTTANMQNQQEQTEKKMPIQLADFLNQRNGTDIIDAIACEILTDGIHNETAITQAFYREETYISDVKDVLFDWKGIDSNSEYNQILQEIIFAYERAAFRAGFETAKKILK